MSDAPDKKKLIVAGAIVGVCVLVLGYVYLIPGGDSPTPQQSAADARAAELEKAAKAEPPQPVDTTLPPVNPNAKRGLTGK